MLNTIKTFIQNNYIQNGRLFFINDPDITTFTSLKNKIIQQISNGAPMPDNNEKRTIEINIYLAFEELADEMVEKNYYKFTLLFFDGSQRRYLANSTLYIIDSTGLQTWLELEETPNNQNTHQYYIEKKHRSEGLPAVIHPNGRLEYWTHNRLTEI